MTQAKTKRKRFSVHNYYKTCGNCGLWLYTDDDIIFINTVATDASHYHATYEGCLEATDKLKSKVGIHRNGKAVAYGN